MALLKARYLPDAVGQHLIAYFSSHKENQ